MTMPVATPIAKLMPNSTPQNSSCRARSRACHHVDGLHDRDDDRQADGQRHEQEVVAAPRWRTAIATGRRCRGPWGFPLFFCLSPGAAPQCARRRLRCRAAGRPRSAVSPSHTSRSAIAASRQAGGVATSSVRPAACVEALQHVVGGRSVQRFGGSRPAPEAGQIAQQQAAPARAAAHQCPPGTGPRPAPRPAGCRGRRCQRACTSPSAQRPRRALRMPPQSALSSAAGSASRQAVAQAGSRNSSSAARQQAVAARRAVHARIGSRRELAQPTGARAPRT